MAVNWRRKRNAFYQRPDGAFVIESSLPIWQAAVGPLMLALQGIIGLPHLPDEYRPGLLLVALLFIGLLYTGLYSSLEIGPGGVVLRRFGWFWPALRVPLTALVLSEERLVPAGRLSRAQANELLHLELGALYESDDEQLFITFRGQEMQHLFDDEVVWKSLKQVAVRLQASGAGFGQLAK